MTPAVSTVEFEPTPRPGGTERLSSFMHIPLAAVEPGDLVAIHVDDDFTIELRTPRNGPASVVKHGRRFLEAADTVARFAAVASPDDTVELLQREGDRPIRHPHGWAIVRPDLTEDLHYFEDTTSACRNVIGYAGLCYPKFAAWYFPEGIHLCEKCLAVVGDTAISS